MPIARIEASEIRSSEDVVRARQLIRKFAVELGLGIVDQTKIITAGSELARNALDYGGGGRIDCELFEIQGRWGLRLVFSDNGPGIADVEAALSDGFTTGNGMGLGLGGAKRLSNEFEIQTAPGRGTRVTIVRWK